MTISAHERALRLSMAHDMGRVFGRIIFRIAPALLLVFVYGVVNLVSMGSAPRHYWHTYVPLVGAVAAILSCVFYPMAMFYGRSWLAASMAITGCIPYLFALFVMVVVGGGRLYGLLSGFSVLGLLGGLFWLVLGYAILYNFWVFTEVGATADKARTRVLESPQNCSSPADLDPRAARLRLLLRLHCRVAGRVLECSAQPGMRGAGRDLRILHSVAVNRSGAKALGLSSSQWLETAAEDRRGGETPRPRTRAFGESRLGGRTRTDGNG